MTRLQQLTLHSIKYKINNALIYAHFHGWDTFSEKIKSLMNKILNFESLKIVAEWKIHQPVLRCESYYNNLNSILSMHCAQFIWSPASALYSASSGAASIKSLANEMHKSFTTLNLKWKTSKKERKTHRHM